MALKFQSPTDTPRTREQAIIAAEQAFSFGDLDAAANQLIRALEIDQNDAELFTALGVVLHQQDKHDKAVIALQQALEIDASNVEALNAMGVVMFRLEWFAAAATFFQRVLALNPQHANARQSLLEAKRKVRLTGDSILPELAHLVKYAKPATVSTAGDHNPNTPEFYDKMYRGSYEVGGRSQQYEYEDPSRRQWYRRLVQMPFFSFEGKLLDVGCGMGGVFGTLPEHPRQERFGVDFSEVALEIVRSRSTGTFLKGDVRSMPFNDRFFDRVLCTETLEHVDDPERVIAEMARVLKPGGKLLITVPEKRLDLKDEEWPGGVSLHVNKFTIGSLSPLLETHELFVESAFIDEREIWLTASKL